MPSSSLPRIVLADFTPIRGTAATSILKANHFGDWDPDRLLLVTYDSATGQLAVGGLKGPLRPFNCRDEAAQFIVDSFAPELILYRPTNDHESLHKFTSALIRESNAGLAIWLMDDWPAQLLASNPRKGEQWHQDLSYLASLSRLNLAISPGMARAFSHRYAAPFDVARNFIDAPLRISPTQKNQNTGELLLRYAGSLAPNMSLAALQRLADFVESCTDHSLNLRLEIRTQDHWFRLYRGQFEGRTRVSIHPSNLTNEQYKAWLSDADILIAAYNDDQETKRYLRYSFSNKVPELLASGRPVLAIGPAEIETIDFLLKTGAAVVVSEASAQALSSAIAPLQQSAEARDQLALKGLSVVKEHFGREAGKFGLRTKLIGVAHRRQQSAASSTQTAQLIAKAFPPEIGINAKAAQAIRRIRGGEAALRLLNALKKSLTNDS